MTVGDEHTLMAFAADRLTTGMGLCQDLAVGASILARWCHELQNHVARRAVRAALIPELSDGTEVLLLEELFRDIDAEEVAALCDAIEQNPTFRVRSLTRTAAGILAGNHSEAVRLWARSHAWESVQAASILARTFRLSDPGFDELVDSTAALDGAQAALLVAMFIDHASGYGVPRWLLGRIRDDVPLWGLLVSEIEFPEVAAVVGSVARDLERSGIALVEGCERRIAGCWMGKETRPICEHAARQWIMDWLDGRSDHEHVVAWLAQPWVIEWLEGVTPGVLRRLASDHVRQNEEAWLRLWQLLAQWPLSVLRKNTGAVQEAVSVLITMRPDQWPARAEDSWATILRSSATAAVVSSHIELCNQALRFALAQESLPVSAVASESFYVVHDAALRDAPPKSVWSIWGFVHPWDRSMELRRQLVDAFVYGRWPPARFVLAAREPWLLRKLCRRMLRHYRGAELLQAAYSELQRGPVAVTAELLSKLGEIIRDTMRIGTEATGCAP